MKYISIALSLALLSSTTSIHATPTAYRGEHSGAFVTVHELEKTKGDILTSKKIRKHYVPLAVHIDNKSDKALTVNQELLSLPIAPLTAVLTHLDQKPEHSLLWPLPLLAGLLIVKPVAFVIGYASVSFASAGALAPLYTDKLRRILVGRASDFAEPVTVFAGTALRTIVFIPKKQYVGDFSINLTTRENDERVSFAVNLLAAQEQLSETIDTDGGPENTKLVIEAPKPKKEEKVKTVKATPAPKQQVVVETDVFETVIEFKEQ